MHFFKGWNVPDDEDDFMAVKKWRFHIVDLFMILINGKHGCFNFLPFPGSILDQPEKTMRILQFIQGEYLSHLESMMKKG
jgi:hypothetical protein